MFGKGDDDDRAEYHNGEGVYIGTSPKLGRPADVRQRHQLAQPSSSGNTITHVRVGVLRRQGERARQPVGGQRLQRQRRDDDFVGSNVELRGYGNIVRNNQISDSAGYTVKIQSDGDEYDHGGNVVEATRSPARRRETLKIKSKATQGRICGNEIIGQPASVDGDFTGDLAAPCAAS